MPDRDGATLTAGDPVFYVPDEATIQPATVLRVLDDDRYLIQLDPREPDRPTNPALVALTDQINAGLAAVDEPDLDSQEPFEVAAKHLVFNWNDDDLFEGEDDVDV